MTKQLLPLFDEECIAKINQSVENAGIGVVKLTLSLEQAARAISFFSDRLKVLPPTFAALESNVDGLLDDAPRKPQACYRCVYRSGSYHLNCAVNPTYTGGECADFLAQETT